MGEFVKIASVSEIAPDRLAQLAGDAALLPIRIAPQRKLAAKAGRDWSPLEGIVDGRLRLEKVTYRQEECGDEIHQKDRPGRLIEPPRSHPVRFHQLGQTLEHLALRRVCDLSTLPQPELNP